MPIDTILIYDDAEYANMLLAVREASQELFWYRYSIFVVMVVHSYYQRQTTKNNINVQQSQTTLSQKLFEREKQQRITGKLFYVCFYCGKEANAWVNAGAAFACNAHSMSFISCCVKPRGWKKKHTKNKNRWSSL